MVVQSSTYGHHHIYWCVKDLSLRAYKYAQKRLAAEYDGDPAVTSYCQLMRLPGFYHHKREPLMVSVTIYNEDPYPGTYSMNRLHEYQLPLQKVWHQQKGSYST